jgi:bifunctional UDP-N-acetylglucosamine pyrophosphorylase/glucosamine-1-phosphate N-acetyltransferase
MKAGVILAAGKGTRLKSHVPKYLQPLANWPLIKHSIYNFKKAGIDETFVVLGYKMDKRLDILKDVKIIEQKKRLGTAHAFEVALKHIPSKFKQILVGYVDVPLISFNTLKKVLKFHERKKAFLTLTYVKSKNPKSYGRIIRDENFNVKKIKEDDALKGRERSLDEINVGFYVFHNSPILKKYLKLIKPQGKKNERWLTKIVEILYGNKEKIEGYRLDDSEEAIGINSRKDLAIANKIFYRRNAYGFLGKGVTIIDPDNTFISGDVFIGKDTIIFPFTYIEPNVKIGNNCSVGPSARIRAGTYISDNVSIGNFAEIVRSKINSGTKVRHFSYIGDAIIGKNVNIGAGTITANYDGKRKNRTIISDNAFIGTGTILIAPVKIGKNAMTGAGSVVTKNRNVKANTIVVGIPARVLRRRKNG